MYLIRACILLLGLILPAWGAAAELVPLPPPGVPMTDLTATLDATQRGKLESQLNNINRSGRAQIAVLILPTTQPESIEQFGIRLAETWKTGRKGINNGAIIIVAKADRKMRIEVGYGLEGDIPDAVAKRIIDETMAPHFRQGDFYGGLSAAVSAMENRLAGGVPATPLPSRHPLPEQPPGHSPDYAAFGIFLFLCLVVIVIVRRAPWLSWAVVAAYLAWKMIHTFLLTWLPVPDLDRANQIASQTSWVVAVITFIIVAWLIPRDYRWDSGASDNNSSDGNYSGGGSDFSSSGDSGGGDFGGGGASGSW